MIRQLTVVDYLCGFVRVTQTRIHIWRFARQIAERVYDDVMLPHKEIEGIGRKGREGHPPRDAAAFFSGGQDPHRVGGPARRGKHSGALPSGGDTPEPLLS